MEFRVAITVPGSIGMMIVLLVLLVLMILGEGVGELYVYCNTVIANKGEQLFAIEQ